MAFLPEQAPVPRPRDPNEVILAPGGPSRGAKTGAAAPKAANGVPALPPGFKLDAKPAQKNLPPLPPGFTLDAAPKTPQPIAAEQPGGSYTAEAGKGLASGVVGTAGTMLKGLAGQNAAMKQDRIDGAKARLRIMDAVDQGLNLPPEAQMDELGTAEAYKRMSPTDRAGFRASQERLLQVADKADVPNEPLFKAGKATTDFSDEQFAAAKGWEDSWTRQISAGLGSTIPFIAAGAIPGGEAVGLATGSALSAGSQIEDAIAHGATKEQIIQAVKLGGVPGLTEQLPIEVLFNRVPLPQMGKFATVLGKVLANVAAEGGQEGLQQAAQNLIARYTYNPDQPISEGVLMSMAVGGIVGGGASVTEQGIEAVAGDHAAAPAAQPVAQPAPNVQSGAATSHPAPPAGFTVDQPNAGAPSQAAPAGPAIAGDEVSPPPPAAQSSGSSIPPQARAMLRASHVSDDEIDAMSQEEAIAEVTRARDAGIVATPEQIQAAAEYGAQPPPAAPPASAEPPAGVPAPAPLNEAAHAAAPSPLNDRPEPTEAQKKAGNYKKGHYRIGGLPISIENPQGSTRSGTSADGTPWDQTMGSHYGYIKGTIGRDKDHVDAFIKPGTASDIGDTSPVFVVNQAGEDGKFDEHKTMIGFDTAEEASAAYHENYPADWQGGADVQATTLGQFKGWLANGNTKRKFIAPAPKDVKVRTAPQPKGPRDIIQFLAAGGGVQDFKGELSGIDAHRAFVPGIGKLVRAKGRSLDAAREAAAEMGYFDHIYPDRETAVEKSTVRDLLDVIDETNRGNRQYSSSDTAGVGDRNQAGAAGEDAARADSARSELAELSGLEAEDPLVERAAMIMLAEGVGADDALERAVQHDDIQDEIVTPDAPVFDDPFFDDEVRGNEVQPGTALEGGQDTGAPGERGQGSNEEGGAQEVGQGAPGGGADSAKPVGQEPVASSVKQGQPVGEQPADTVDPFDAAFDSALDEVKAGEREVVGGPYGTGPTEGRQLSQEIVNDTVRSRAWKTVFGNSTNVNAPTQHYAHPTSPVAWERVAGWLDAKDGKEPRAREHGGEAIDPYMEGYVGGRYGDAFVIRASDAASLRKSIIDGTFDKPGPNDEPIVEPGAEGKPQTVIPGAERITKKQEADRAAGKPMRGKVPQKEPAGMFSDDVNEPQLFDKPAPKPADDPFFNAKSSDERWWDHQLTPFGRREVMEAVGVKLPDAVLWHHVSEANRAKLLAGRAKLKSAGAAAKSVASNVGMGLKDVTKGLSELFGGKGAKLSSGLSFDDETYAKAKPFFKAGIAHFAEAGRDVATMVKHLVRYLAQNGMNSDAIAAMRPYMRRFIEEETATKAPPTETGKLTPEAKPDATSPLEAMRDRLLDDTAAPFPTINQARKFLLDAGWTPANPEVANKEAEEIIEHAVVLAARDIVSWSKKKYPADALMTKEEATYDALVELYARQPRLASRTSTSMAEQAYSTPVPLAYVASRLADITSKSKVLEPTAGNGALLIEANPRNAFVNELNNTRMNALAQQGFNPAGRDATEPGLHHAGYPVDVVIANPPFGAVRENGESKVFDVDGFRTTAVDHAISLNALKHMKDDGRAVLIVGSVKAENEALRSDGYNTQQKRKFYKRLYDNYRVVDHFTVSGDLYARQGAGWPVDVIVIDGKGKSSLSLPAVKPPRMISSWADLKGYVNADARSGAISNTGGTQVSRPSPVVDRPGGRGTEGGRPAGGAGSTRNPTGTGGEPAPSSVPPDRGQREPFFDLAPGPIDRPLESGRKPGGANLATPAKPRDTRVASQANATGQVPYRPYSREGASLNTLVPSALGASMDASLARIEQKHGDIDAYVARELGYEVANLKDVFSAEQIDALALAMDNVAKGDAFIIGDQTGIGKGRVVAGAIRYAHKLGMVPVFVTEKPDLYGDMYRDINDIQWAKSLGREPIIFMTNAGTVVPLDDEAVNWISDRDDAKLAGMPVPPRRGKFTAAQSTETAEKRMREILSGEFKPDVIFTSYDQQNSQQGQETARRVFMDRVAPRSFLIMDESHNAGGQGPDAASRAPKDKAPPRSVKFREWVNKAKSVMYSSATYAKNPQVMDLYSRTDMAKAVAEPKDLPELIVKGGVPLQQIVASMLADAGQYARRERSFEGIEYALEVAEVDQQNYADFAGAIASIFKFDRAITDFRKEWIDQWLKENGAGLGMDSGVGDISANSTAFASIMHNIVNQMLLSIKADGAASRAIAAIEAGEKPVIALALTSESFLSDFADDAGIKVGQPIDIDFRDVVRRYLERTLRITVKTSEGEKQHIYIPHDELAGFRDMFDEALDQVNALDLSKMPVSPLDWLRKRISEAGYSIREITGRQSMIHYGTETTVALEGGGEIVKDGGMTLVRRDTAERGPGGKKVTINRFNDGALDAVIINASGSTGISMHSKASFKDRRKRRMIILQANGNPDVHMQTLGRVNRTGQVNLPAYTQMAADIPAEARPIAVLMKKMASLSANTTASRKSAFSTENAVDFMNEYGDLAAVQWAQDNPDEHADLGWPIQFDEKGRVTAKNPIQRLTGRLMLLTPDQQQDMIDKLTESYKAIVEQKTALGENALEARALDLQAEPVSKAEIKPATGASPFQAAAHLETMRVKSPGRAMKPNEVVSKVARTLAQPRADETLPFARRMENLASNGRAASATMMRDAEADYRGYKPPIIKDANKAAAQQKALAATAQHWREIMARGPVGAMVTIQAADRADAPAIQVIVVDIERSEGKKGNPLAGSKWNMTFAIPDSSRQLTMPLSQITTAVDEGASGIMLTGKQHTDSYANIEKQFDQASREGKEERMIATGNLLAAYDQLSGRGQIIQFTNAKGDVQPGILMPRDYSVEQFERERRVRFVTPGQVMAFLDQSGLNRVETSNDLVAVEKAGNWYNFIVDAGRAKGGKYFTDTAVRAVYDNWVRKPEGMLATVQGDKARDLISAMQAIGARFVSPDEHALATEIVHGKKQYQAAVKERAPFGKKRRPINTRATARIHQIVKEVAGIDPQMIYDDEGIVGEAAEWGDGPITAAGFYDYAEDIIGISFRDVADTTAYHEAFHRLQIRFLTKAERQVLASETERLRRLIGEHGGRTAEAVARMAPIEVEAEAFALWSILRDRNDVAGLRMHIALRRAWERLRLIVQRVRNALQGMGYKTAEDIFAEAKSGAIAKRGPIRAAPQPGKLLYQWIDIARHVGDATVVFDDPWQARFFELGRKLMAANGISKSQAQHLEFDPATIKIPGLSAEFGEVYGRIEPYLARDEQGNKLTRAEFTEAVMQSAAHTLDEVSGKSGEVEANSVIDPDALHEWTRRINRDQNPRPASRVFQAAGATTMPLSPARGMGGAIVATRMNAALTAAVRGLKHLSPRDRRTADDQETAGNYLHRKWIDYLQPLLKMQEEGGHSLTELNDAYLNARIAEDSALAQMEGLNEKYATPMVDALAAGNASFKEFHDYSVAMHAEERNRVVGERNPSDSDLYKAITDTSIAGASGISTDQANATIASLRQDPAKFRALRIAHGHLRAMLDDNLRESRRRGLISDETYTLLTTQWRNYVPLKGNEGQDEQGFWKPGLSGFDVRGSEFKTALGRYSEAENVIAHAVTQTQQSILRQHKNEVGKALLRFINQFDPEGESIAQVFWAGPDGLGDIVKAEQVFRRKIGKDGKVTWYRVPNPFANRDDVLAAKIGGKSYYIRFADPKIGLALRKMGMNELGLLSRIVRPITVWQSIVNTRANPAFTPINIVRDLQAGTVHLLDEGFSAAQIAKVIANIPKAIAALWRKSRGGAGTADWDRHAAEYIANGGKITFHGYSDLEGNLKKLERQITRAAGAGTPLRKAGDIWNAITKFVGDLNDAGENGIRLAAYVAARTEQGRSAKEAAFMARDLTVDFKKHGEFGPAMNSFYVFFNAAIQGNFNIGRRLIRSRKVQAAVAGFIFAGMMEHFWNSLMAGDDDDGESAYKKMLRTEGYKLERQLVFFIPGTKRYVSFPMPYGYNAFHFLGVQGAAMMDGSKSPTDGMLDILRVGFDAFNPVGSGSMLSMITPTIGDPIVEIATNENFFGGAIVPDENPFDAAPPPQSTQSFNSTHPVWRMAAEALNKMTGGDEIEPGAVDVYPDTLEHLWGYFSGGIGRFAASATDATTSAVQGDIEPKKVPWVKSFYGEVDEQTARNDYFRRRERIEWVMGKLKERQEEGDQAKIDAFIAKYQPEIDAGDAFKAAEKQRRSINKERRRLPGADMTSAERNRTLEELDKQEAEAMRAAREAIVKAEQP